MVSQRFRIKNPVIVLVDVGGRHAALEASVGEIVTVTNGPLDGLRMVEVKWRDQIALMFTAELREHADWCRSRLK